MEYPIDIAQRQQEAKEHFRQGYNCCQAVLLAFKDLLGLDENTILKISSGLGGGYARMREVCGSVSAMTIAAGFIRPACNPAQMSLRRDNYALVQEMAEDFRKINGSIVCRELLGLKAACRESAQPSERTDEYYKGRPCEKLVEDAVRIIAEKIQTK